MTINAHDLSDIPLPRIAAWERHGVDAIEADLISTGGMRLVGGPAEIPHQAWRWVHAHAGVRGSAQAQ